MNNPALNKSSDIHIGLLTTMATSRKRIKPLIVTELTWKKKPQTDKDRNKGKIVMGDRIIYGIGIKAEINLSFHHEFVLLVIFILLRVFTYFHKNKLLTTSRFSFPKI